MKKLGGLGWVGIVGLLSWLGLYLHELWRVPKSLGFTPDESIPMLVVVSLLIAGYWRAGAQTWVSVSLLAFGLLNLLGAAVTAFPIALLPFVPEQSAEHYGVHLVYGLLQLPIIALGWKRMRIR